MVTWPFGLYGHGMHDFVMRELEIGHRAATYEDSEACGWSALMDLSYEQYIREQSGQAVRVPPE